MAIPSYVGAELTKELNTFEDWFNRTNSITTDLGSRVVHAQANTAGGTTTGNVNIVGIFSANTVAVKDGLRGGTVEVPDTLLISSNVNMNGGSSLVSNTVNHTHKSNTFILTSNTVTTSGNTFTINHTNINFNGAATTFSGTAVYVNSDEFIINGNTSFNANNVIISNLGGDLTVNGTVTAIDFNSTSDISLKENVKTLSNSIDIINQINPVSFNWKSSGDKSYGVIAQELNDILPELVNEKENGIKTVAYTQLIAFLISAVQEQQKEIDHIKSLLQS